LQAIVVAHGAVIQENPHEHLRRAARRLARVPRV